MLKFVILLLSSFILGISAACDSLIYREGVRVRCKNPNTDEVIDCHGGAKLPTGTVATYNCVNNYYVALNDDVEDGQLICSPRSQWIGRAEFLAFSCAINCGLRQLTNAVGFVVGGTETQRELWPWHASIFSRQNLSAEFKYICGGTLIKPFNKGFLILTAAHCLANDARQRREDLENIRIVLGGEFSSLEENLGLQDVQIHEVHKIVLHKSFEGIPGDFQADIALISLIKTVELNPNVIPACFSRSVDVIEERGHGEVVGFGQFSERDPQAVSFTLRNVTLPVVNSNLCFEWRQRQLTPYEFCAGTENFQGVCNGDNGGGFMLKSSTNGFSRYYIQGIASHGKKDLSGGFESCDSYSVFTKVNSYAKWIRDTAEELFPEGEQDSPLPAQTSTTPIHATEKIEVTPIPTTETPKNSQSILVSNFEKTLPTTPAAPEITTIFEILKNSTPATFEETTAVTDVSPESIEGTTEVTMSTPTKSTTTATTLIANSETTIRSTTNSSTSITSTATSSTTKSPPEVIDPSTTVEVTVVKTSQHRRRQTVPAKAATTSLPFSNRAHTQQYELKSLERHNFYRSMHDSPPLRLSARMKQRAQAYANKLIREGTFENEHEEGINKNVYYVTGNRSTAETSVVAAVNAWYDDISSYNWDNPYYSTFSQVVWKDTTDMGTGVASNGRRTIVVVAYFPAGNILGENGKHFHENVFPKTST